jgi:hypothetical protein
MALVILEGGDDPDKKIVLGKSEFPAQDTVSFLCSTTG